MKIPIASSNANSTVLPDFIRSQVLFPIHLNPVNVSCTNIYTYLQLRKNHFTKDGSYYYKRQLSLSINKHATKTPIGIHKTYHYLSINRLINQPYLKIYTFCCCNCFKKSRWHCTSQTISVRRWNRSRHMTHISVHVTFASPALSNISSTKYYLTLDA